MLFDSDITNDIIAKKTGSNILCTSKSNECLEWNIYKINNKNEDLISFYSISYNDTNIFKSFTRCVTRNVFSESIQNIFSEVYDDIDYNDHKYKVLKRCTYISTKELHSTNCHREPCISPIKLDILVPVRQYNFMCSQIKMSYDYTEFNCDKDLNSFENGIFSVYILMFTILCICLAFIIYRKSTNTLS